MAFRLILRGSAPRTAIADYECPVHGRFEAQVERDENGDPPEHVQCCEAVLRFDPNTTLASSELCGRTSEYRISAPLTRVRKIEAAKKGGWTKPERKEWQ